jgi:hypothetical protein
MKVISRLAEQRIRQAQEEGLFEDLESAGRPLVFEDETWIPEDLRIAYRMLKGAGFVPPELELRNEIINLRSLVETIDDDRERMKKLMELNFKLLSFNLSRKKPLQIEDFPEYEYRVASKISGL